jgi:alpha-galactosidase
MKIHDLGDADHQMHSGVGSQLIYNRTSRESLFVGALTSDKFLTIVRAHVAGGGTQAGIASYEVDSAGTTELTKQYPLLQAPPADQMELSVRVEPGKEISSGRLLISLGDDYHSQLTTYGELIRDLHHARVSAPTPMGWWSWTAYYAGLDQQKALANAEWLAKNLKDLGYKFFHIDEGYSIARGEYLTPNAKLFPDGAEKVETKAAGLGLVPGIWTAPFEVSERSWVYKTHPEWLVHNAAGRPIRLAGSVMPRHESIYVLDATHPGAQEYLRKTYSTMTRQWGVRYIKLDFMEDTCIEGERYRPDISALEAQRIGLKIIRETVGDGVYLDKDGSVMLNPVGIVDMGRISQDTAHHFSAIKDAATGILARYYMNRNFFIADPDAFMVTKGEGENQFSLSEAKVSIALSALSGGMLEIGNDLPSLSAQPERLALIENKDLVEIAHLGKAAVPVDLMSYRPEDGQPSIFYLRESPKVSILAVFNWTDGSETRGISASTLGLTGDQTYTVQDIWDGRVFDTCHQCVFNLKQEPHSVKMLKITEIEPWSAERD